MISHGSARSALGIESGRPPVQVFAFNGHDVEAAGRRIRPTHQEMRGRALKPLALGGGDAGSRATVRGGLPLPDFNEHDSAVGRAHDEINLATARAGAAGEPIIAPHERQTLRLQMKAGAVFGLLTPQLRVSHGVLPTA